MARSTGTANLAASLEVLAGAPLDARTIVPTVSDLTVAANFPYKYVGMPVVTQDTGDMYVLTASDVTESSNWKKLGSGGGGLTETIRYNIVTKSIGNYDASITVNKYVDDELESSTDYLYTSLSTAVIIDNRIQLQYYSTKYHMTLLADSTTESTGYTTQWAYNESIDFDQSFISEAYRPYVVDGYYKAADHLFYEESTYTTAIPGKAATVYVDLSTSKSYRYDSTNQIFVRLDEESAPTYTAGDGIDISNNEISTDNMPAEDMSEIVSPLPGIMSRRVKYSTSEQVIGEWINGKPLYQKTLTKNFAGIEGRTRQWVTLFALNELPANIDVCYSIQGYYDKYMFPLINSTSDVIGFDSNLYYGSAGIQVLHYGNTWLNEAHTLTLTMQYTKTTDTAS